MTVTIYRSSDTGAPTLDGQLGSLITVLDACLVGSGGFAYGSTPSSGWTKSYSGTNLAAYRQGSGSNQFYLKVRDDGPRTGSSASANEARIRGFETMTQVTASNDGTDGTNPFPTIAQVAAVSALRKSASADNIARPWIIAADARTFYLFVLTGDTAGMYYTFMFGEFYSFKSSDPGRCFIILRGTENSTTASIEPDRQVGLQTNLGASPVIPQYLARDHTGAAGAVTCAWVGRVDTSAGSSNSAIAFAGLLLYTNQPDHRIYLAPIRLHNGSATNTNFRGRVRGLWHWLHPIATCTDGQILTGTGNLTGKTFMVIKQTVNAGVWVVETSNTWDSN